MAYELPFAEGLAARARDLPGRCCTGRSRARCVMRSPPSARSPASPGLPAGRPGARDRHGRGGGARGSWGAASPCVSRTPGSRCSCWQAHRAGRRAGAGGDRARSTRPPSPRILSQARGRSERLARVRSGGQTWRSSPTCDLVVEAIAEDLAAKQAAVRSPGARLSTRGDPRQQHLVPRSHGARARERPRRRTWRACTSSIPPTRCASWRSCARRATAPEVSATLLKLGRRLGKVPVLVGARRGFRRQPHAVAPLARGAVHAGGGRRA